MEEVSRPYTRRVIPISEIFESARQLLLPAPAEPAPSPHISDYEEALAATAYPYDEDMQQDEAPPPTPQQQQPEEHMVDDGAAEIDEYFHNLPAQNDLPMQTIIQQTMPGYLGTGLSFDTQIYRPDLAPYALSIGARIAGTSFDNPEVNNGPAYHALRSALTGSALPHREFLNLKIVWGAARGGNYTEDPQNLRFYILTENQQGRVTQPALRIVLYRWVYAGAHAVPSGGTRWAGVALTVVSLHNIGILQLRLTPPAPHDNGDLWWYYIQTALEAFRPVNPPTARYRVFVVFRTTPLNTPGIKWHTAATFTWRVTIAETDVTDGFDGLSAAVRQKLQEWANNHERYTSENPAGVDNLAGTLSYVDVFIRNDNLRMGCIDKVMSGYYNLLRWKSIWLPNTNKNSNDCFFACINRLFPEHTIETLRAMAQCPGKKMVTGPQVERVATELGVVITIYRKTRAEPGDPCRFTVYAKYGLKAVNQNLLEALSLIVSENTTATTSRALPPQAEEIREVNLWEQDNHCALILDKRALRSEFCIYCGKAFKTGSLEAHYNQCKYCTVCRSSWWDNGKKPHTCNANQLAYNAMLLDKNMGSTKWVQRGGYEKCVEPGKNTNEKEDLSGENVAFADFETFRPADSPVEVVYAGCLSYKTESSATTRSSCSNSNNTEYDPDTDMEGYEMFLSKGPDTISDFVNNLSVWSNKLYGARDKLIGQNRSRPGKKAKNAAEVIGTLVMYNGSRFDSFFLLNELVKRGIQIEDLALSNGAILSFKMFGNLRVFDLCRFTIASLRQACKDFGCETGKGEFDHRKIRSWEDVTLHQAEWGPYLIRDVISMQELYFRFSNMFFRTFRINIKSRFTISQTAYEFWTTTIDSAALNLTIPPLNIDRFFRRGVYGGMSLPQKQYFHSRDFTAEEVEKVVIKSKIDNTGRYLDEEADIEAEFLKKPIGDYLVDTDVVSLYPTAMKQDFPTGSMVYTTEGEKLTELWGAVEEWVALGIKPMATFIAEVDMLVPKDLVCVPLPRKKKDGSGVKWDLKDITRQVYTSVDLYRALVRGYKIKSVHSAVYWETQAKVFEKYVDQIAEMKKKAKKGTAMYTIAKLMLNALYGKTIMKPILDQSAIIYNEEDLHKFCLEAKLSTLVVLGDPEERVKGDILYWSGPAFVAGEKLQPHKACNKPSQMGAFVLSWSRYIMDEGVTAIDGWKDIDKTFYYRDTDSSVVHSSQLHSLREKFGKDFGCLDYDVQGRIVEYCSIGPKAYIFCYQGADGRLFYHKRCKGISPTQWYKMNMELFIDMMENHTTFECKGDDTNPYIGFKRIRDHVNSKQAEKGITPFSIRIEDMTRTVNKTPFTKRNRILLDETTPRPDYATLPIGYNTSVDLHQVDLASIYCTCDLCKKLGYIV